MKRFTRPFRQLRGRLTLSYMLTSVVTFLLVEVIGITLGFTIASANINNIIAINLEQVAPQAGVYFTNGVPDSQLLTNWLHTINSNLSNQWLLSNNQPLSLTVTDAQGQVVASIGQQSLPLSAPVQAHLSPQVRESLTQVLNGGQSAKSIGIQQNDGTLIAIAPIKGALGNVQGALVMKIAQGNRLVQVVGFLQLIVVTVIIVTILAAISGLIFGYLVARNITRRLKRLSIAADRWGQGDFSAQALDSSEDELGQTARQLNRMAEELQLLLQARQELATLEERNRLARDLHDSVKQQIFAISMQIGATKLLLKRDVPAAEARLNEAEKLIHQAQQELTSLIRELRPVALEGKGLSAALRELAMDWTAQTGIVANARVEGNQNNHPLSLAVEEALFRVAQEALSNAARHSQATLVQMTLTVTGERVTLTVVDNGQGFDMTHQRRLAVGLLSMQERMKALGGNAQVESAPGKGTRITAYCHRSNVADAGGAGDAGSLVASISEKDAVET